MFLFPAQASPEKLGVGKGDRIYIFLKKGNLTFSLRGVDSFDGLLLPQLLDGLAGPSGSGLYFCSTSLASPGHPTCYSAFRPSHMGLPVPVGQAHPSLPPSVSFQSYAL